jgi:DNA-binding GntR family transcriptional regulator
MSSIEGVLIRTLLQMQFKALRTRGLASWRTRAQGFQPDRRAILDAIAARDVEAAAVASQTYHAHQRRVFMDDPALAKLVFSDPSALRVAEELSVSVRQRVTG